MSLKGQITMASITAILKNNNLPELSLGDIDELSDPTYIIWSDNNGTSGCW